VQKSKLLENFEIEADQLEWLKAMAESYSLPDASKALRVVLDHAMQDADEDQVFMAIRCRRCGG
jgi:hypothetical protein